MPKLIRPRQTNKSDMLAFLRMLYLKTEQDIINEIMRKRASNYVDYAEVAALERVQSILQSMIDETWSYVPVMIEKIFYDTFKDIRGYNNARTLTFPQTAVVEQLASNLIGEVVEAAGVAEKTAAGLLAVGRQEADIYHTEVLKAVAQKEASGASVAKTTSQIKAELNNKGVTAFIDKGGREWGLSDYTTMAVRTTAKQAQVAAILTEDPEHDLYMIARIGSTCPICAPLEGRVYSRSGDNPDYPPLSLAFGKIEPGGGDDLSNTYLNIHPNCLHPLVKYTTMGKTDKQIQRDKDFSDPRKNPIDVDPRSKRQIEEYKKKVAARQKLLNERKQHQAYREVLGKNVPARYEKFHELKQEDPEKWKALQASYRQKNAQARVATSQQEGGTE